MILLLTNMKCMKKGIILLGMLALSHVLARGQKEDSKAVGSQSVLSEKKIETEGKLKFSGYLQTDIAWGMPEASLKVGRENEDLNNSFSRLGVRRGRLKASYSERWVSAVLQIDMTEKSVSLKDAYLNVALPFLGASSVRAGVFDRPFGHEITFSSSRRESPERSTLFQTLFPNERDLGAKITLQPSKGSAWSLLVLDAGLFAGNGIKPEVDSRLDFIGRLSASRKKGDWEWGLGSSLYYGGVYQGTSKVFTMENGAWQEDNRSENLGAYARRFYVGVDAQCSLNNSWGRTHLRGEWITGQQPGTSSSSNSPNFSALPKSDTYIRPFQGGYAVLVQDIGKLPLAAFAKYDWYDPNTQVKGDAIGKNATNQADIAYQTLGCGVLYRITPNLKLTGYYEWVSNETTTSLAAYASDRRDNRLTFRLQYQF